MEHETFWTLLHDGAHWQFEIFLMILFDGVLGLIIWPFVKEHWTHHLDRDAKEGESSKVKKLTACPWCRARNTCHLTNTCWHCHRCGAWGELNPLSILEVGGHAKI